ncbi:MAG: hypothetical protein H7842_10585 [Gammaproteobacteria bacterium SHHR-1]|uniref:hypothetical protein n=1 Tax=Magnetovirga frankeli TaxID=947516 RepID=UPI0012932786|nr:hypothetical protein D5125_12060 [gamma proteobacterium SS-5]
MRRLLCTLLMLFPLGAAAGELLGYGVRPCEDYLRTYQGWEQDQPKAVMEYFHYQDWLAGFISGLNYATGDDQLRGVGIPGVLRRNRIHCQERPNDDFFTATMALIRGLKDLP